MSARSFKRQRERETRKSERRRLLRSRRAIATGAVVGATALFGPAAASAATFTVDNTSDTTTAGACDDAIAVDCSLRQAVDDANGLAGLDVVSFSGLSGSLITLTNGPIHDTGSVDIQGPGMATLTVSGDADGDGERDIDEDSSIFTIDSPGPQLSVAISGLTLSGGVSHTASAVHGTPGGAINATGTDLSISDSALSGNEATFTGGAVYLDGGDLAITDSTLSGNTAYAQGGAVYLDSGELTISGSEISDNTARGTDVDENAAVGGGGGGVYGKNLSVATIVGSNIKDNSTHDETRPGNNGHFRAEGGGLDLAANPSGEIHIEGSDVTGNGAMTYGGGARFLAPTISVGGSTIADNGASSSQPAGNAGGGIFATGGMELTASTVSGNRESGSGLCCLGSGGGVSWRPLANGDGMDVENSTISGNTAAGSAGGVSLRTLHYYDAATHAVLYSGPVTFRNSTIASNHTAYVLDGIGIQESAKTNNGYSTPGVILSSTIVGDSVGPPPTYAAHSDVSAGGSTPGFQAQNSLVESFSPGDLTETPPGSDIIGADPQLGALADNGGPTMTQLPAATSPAVDSGLSNGLVWDQRGPGFPRTNDAPGVPNHCGGDGTDMGAVEVPLPSADAVDGCAADQGSAGGSSSLGSGAAGPQASPSGGVLAAVKKKRHCKKHELRKKGKKRGHAAKKCKKKKKKK